MNIELSANQFILITLLIKLGIMAGVSSLLIRPPSLRDIIFKDRKTTRDSFILICFMGSVLAIGVTMRLLVHYQGCDLSLSGTVLAGLVGGPLTGLGVGLLTGLPPLFYGEYLALPLGLLYGLGGAFLYYLQPSQKKRMEFSPFPFILLYQFSRDWLKSHRANWNLIPLSLMFSLETLRLLMAHHFGQNRLFALWSDDIWVFCCVLGFTASCLGIPLRIWNNTWMQMQLQEKDRLLMEARLAELASKIQPHFLFNTLNTIQSLIRTDPDKARFVLQKLASILQSLFDSPEPYRTLAAEIEFVKAYLAIQEIRFGPVRLGVAMNIDPAINEVIIPAMIIQPIVENSIKHGLSRQMAPGRIEISGKIEGDFLSLCVKDNGQGMPLEIQRRVKTIGHGLANVAGRLQLIYGERYLFTIESEPKQGTAVTFKLPLICPTGSEVSPEGASDDPPQSRGSRFKRPDR